MAVRCPRVRDRVGEGPERIRFSSAILPPYARRSKSLEVLIPILYLKGISTGDFEEALIGQMPVAHQPLAAVVGQLVGMAAEQSHHFRLNGLRQQRSRSLLSGQLTLS